MKDGGKREGVKGERGRGKEREDIENYTTRNTRRSGYFIAHVVRVTQTPPNVVRVYQHGVACTGALVLDEISWHVRSYNLHGLPTYSASSTTTCSRLLLLLLLRYVCSSILCLLLPPSPIQINSRKNLMRLLHCHQLKKFCCRLVVPPQSRRRIANQ